MAKERIVNVRFWRDNYIGGLKADARLLFLWAITNPATELCGAYETTLSTIEAETGLKRKRIVEIFDEFHTDGKILYKDGWVIVKNFAKHQHGTSTNIKAAVTRTLNDCPNWVKDTVSNGIDTRSHLDLDSVRQPKPKPLENGNAAIAAAEKSDPVERRIWTDGIDLLAKNGMTEANARPLLGRLAKQYTKPTLAEAIAVTQSENPADPKAFLIGVLKERSGENMRLKSQIGKYDPVKTATPIVGCATCLDCGWVHVPAPNAEFDWQVVRVDCPDCSMETL